MLNFIKQEIHNCKRCNLRNGARLPVPGTGLLRKRLVLVGEAPGEEEDLKNEPFVGAAGNLLTRALNKLSVNREDIYITNTVKCRPPQNRTPTLSEITACRPWLEKEFELIKPLVIICLGRTALNGILNITKPLSNLRGKILYYRDIPAVITYHPAFLLRNPSNIYKLQFLEDLKKGFKLYEILNNQNVVEILRTFNGTIEKVIFTEL